MCLGIRSNEIGVKLKQKYVAGWCSGEHAGFIPQCRGFESLLRNLVKWTRVCKFLTIVEIKSGF